MKLEEMVIATAKCWNGTTEVLFNNGYCVSYEKIPYGKQGRGRHKTTLIETNEYTVTCELFEPEMNPAMREKVESDVFAYKRMEKLDDALRDCYQKAIKLLDFKKQRYICWKQFNEGFRMLLTWPITGPINAWQGLRAGALGCIVGLFHPFFTMAYSFFGKTYVVDKKHLCDKQDGNPALCNTHGAQAKLNSFPAPEYAGFLFPPDNLRTKEYASLEFQGACINFDADRKFEIKYKRSEHFVKLNKDICDKIYRHLGALENERRNWREFKEQLTEENQIAMLKSIGFL